MAQTLECSNGHRWPSQIAGADSGEHGGSCPVCGAPALVPVGGELATSPSLNLPEPDDALALKSADDTLGRAPEDTLSGTPSQPAAVTSTTAPSDATTQVASRDVIKRGAAAQQQRIVEQPRAAAPPTEDTIDMEPGEQRAQARAEDASDSTAVLEPGAPPAKRPPSQLEATAFIAPKTRPEISADASDDTAQIEPRSPSPNRPASALEETTIIAPKTRPEIAADPSDTTAQIEPKGPSGNRPASALEETTFMAPPTRPDIGADSGDTTVLPPGAKGNHPGSHLLTTQFEPPPTVPGKKKAHLDQTTVFEPDSTNRPPHEEETAYLSGDSGPKDRADPSATSVLDSTSAPSDAEVTTNFQSDPDVTAAGDSASTGVLGDSPSTDATLEAKTKHPKSRARLGLKEISGYEIISELGRGGMGVVYKARQKGIGRFVALKRILSNDISQNDIVRFRIEAEAVGKIQHPNIVQIYDVGEEKGKPWCALEYLDGGSLHGKLKGEPQPVRKIAETLEPISRALDACHKVGIIHRDIKPANILLASDGTPKVTDFGLAKRLDEDVGQTRSGTILGTPSYMAPEQAEGKVKEIGPAADIYSVGAMMYEMITGRPPLKGETVIDTLLLVQSTDPLSPSVLIPKVPRDLETICMKCLQKQVEKRYATCGELADDLRRFLDGEPIAARPITPREKAIRWVKKNKIKAVLLGSGAAMFVGMLVGSLVYAKQESDKAQLESSNAALARAKQEESEAKEQEATKRAAAEALGRQIAVESAVKIADQKDKAENNYSYARLAVDEMLTRVARERLAHQPHMEKIRRDLLLSALNFYQWLRGYKGDDPNLRWETGRAYVRVGDIREALGERAEAEKSYRTALEYLEGLVKQFPDNPLYKRELASTLNNLGNLLQRFNDFAAAQAALQHSAELRQQLDQWNRSAAPFGVPASLVGLGFSADNALSTVASALISREDADSTLDLAQINNNLGTFAYNRNQLKEAEGYFRKALDAYDRLTTKHPKVDQYRFDQAKSFDNLGELLAKLGKQKEAKTALENARENLLQLIEAIKKGEVSSPEYRQELAKCYDHLGNLIRDTDPPRAQKLHQNSLALRVKLVEDFPDMLDYRQEMATSLNNMAIAWLAAGDVARARQMFDEALQAQERLVALAPLDRGFRSDLASTSVNAAISLQQRNEFTGAEKYYAEALKHLDQLVQRYPSVPDYLRDTAAVLEHLSILQVLQHQPNEALASAQKSRDLRERLAKQWPQVPVYQQEVARSQNFLGTLLRQVGKQAEAEKPYRRAIEILTQLDQKYKNVPDYGIELAQVYGNLADLLKTPDPGSAPSAVPASRKAEAEKAWHTAIDRLTELSKAFPTIPVYQKEAARSEAALAQFLDAATRNTEAEQHWQRAVAILTELRQKYPEQPEYALELAQVLGKRGFSNAIDNRFQRAQECFFEAIAILEPLAIENPRVPEYWTELFNDYENLARSVKLLDLLQDAENIRRHMVALREKQLAAFPGNADVQCSLAGSHNDLGAILAQRDKLDEAEKNYQKAVSDLRGLLAKKPQPADCGARLVQAYVGLAETQLEHANHAEAALNMSELANEMALAAADSVRIAGVLARSADVAAADETLAADRRQELSRRYADRAMESLRKAVGQGFRDVDYLKQAMSLAPLRSRADFQQLLRDVQSR